MDVAGCELKLEQGKKGVCTKGGKMLPQYEVVMNMGDRLNK